MNRHRTRVLGARTLAPETLMMGYGYDPALSEGAIKAPLFQSSTFVFKSAEDGKRFFEVAYGLRQRDPDEALGLIYSRINNPNLEILEDRLAVWDKADKALVFSTGMAAISTAMLALVRPGDVILYTAPAYGGTEYLFDRILPRYGVKAISVPAAEGADAMDAAMTAAAAQAKTTGGRLAAVYLETPANPTNQLVDIARAVAGAKAVDQVERPIVAVAKKPGAEVSREELLQFFEGKAAKWQVPDDVVFVDSIPLGATGKMLKTKLREDLKDYKLPTA